MIFRETALHGAFLIELEPFEDHRGYFARTYCRREFDEHGLATDMVQTNASFNYKQGTLRGLHYQRAPFGEAKLVRTTRGAIYDVIVDLRVESDTYLQWIGVELTSRNRRMLYVPEHFAHGFMTLEDETEVTYQVSQFYQPGAEQGLRFDDPAFAIEWPLPVSVISDKDRSWPDFAMTHIERRALK